MIGAAILGTGGIAAWVRARGQNRIDMLVAYEKRITAIEARYDALDKRNDELTAQNAELLGRAAALEAEKRNHEDRLGTQRALIDELQQRVAQLTTVEEENARLRNQVIKAEATARFLQDENNVLRLEINQLRMGATS